MVHDPEGLVQVTADEQIYDVIIPKKYQQVVIGERALKKVAIDYHLFKNMYKERRSPSPKPPTSAESRISYENNEDVNFKNEKENQKCPKKRRPINGNCPSGWEVRKNKFGQPCCYKERKPRAPKRPTVKREPVVKPEMPTELKKEQSCPVQRRPVDGKCPEGYMLKENKCGGVPCCYKTTRTRNPRRFDGIDLYSLSSSNRSRSSLGSTSRKSGTSRSSSSRSSNRSRRAQSYDANNMDRMITTSLRRLVKSL